MKKTICLNMIVKNEAENIERCLASVKRLIDYWVIVDTGSTDGTQQVIREFFKEFPGDLHERPWVHFSHNRNEAMQLAECKGDYLLFIDADDRLVFSEDFLLPNLESDIYAITQREGIGNTFREHHVFSLIKNHCEFEWRGKIHEYLASKTERPKTIDALQNVWNDYGSKGCRSRDPNKCQKDIELLKEDPDSSRDVFYLARTYYSIEEYEKSLSQFDKRSRMGDDPMEVYYSLLYCAIIQKRLGYAPDVFIDSFCKAHLYRPSRAEALYEIGRYQTEKGNHFLSFLILSMASQIPITQDNLFVESWVQDWGIALYLFICARSIGMIDESEKISEYLINNPRFPDNIKKSLNLNERKKN